LGTVKSAPRIAGLISAYNSEKPRPSGNVRALGMVSVPLALRAARRTNRQTADSRVAPSEDMVPASLNIALKQLTEETVVAFRRSSRTESSHGILIIGGVRSSWVPISSQTLSLVASRFIAECSNPNSSIASLQSDSRQLYRWMIRPIESHLEQRRTLVIEPDSLLDNVPVQALADDQDRYLGTRYPMVWSWDFGYQQQLRSDTPFTSGDRALVVGAPSVQSKNFLLVSASTARRLERSRKCRIHVLQRNSVDRFSSNSGCSGKQITGTQIFHFAGHALSGVQRNGLLLASQEQPEIEVEVGSESLLDAARLRSSSFTQCHLAVLSACQTAIGNKPGMTDPSGLVRTFLRLDVPHVVATRLER